MAVLSSEWLLTPNPPHRTHYQTRTLIISISYIVPPPRRLPIPPSTRNFPIVSSSKSHSVPLLEESPTTNDLHVIQFHSDPPIPQPSHGISNEFIRALAKNPQTEALAHEYYQKARTQPGFRPDRQLLRLLSRYLLRSKQWNSISTLSEDIKSSGVFPDRSTCCKLVIGCIRARKFRVAESLLEIFQASEEIAVSAFGSVMRSYNRLHMYSSAVLVHERMRAAGFSPDSACYCWVMDAYRKLGNTDRVVALFLEFESEKFDPSAETARIYSTLCDSLGRSGRAFEALRYFREMTEKGIPADPSLYSSLVCSFAGIKEAEIAEDLFQEAREKGMVKDPAVFLKLVLMYVEVGSAGKTLDVVRAMKEMGIGVSDCVFCAVINGHVRRRGLRAAVGAYEELISLGCEPGQVTYASVLNVYCRLGLFAKTESLFLEMIEKGFDRCVVAYSNMVSMYGKSGRVRDAMRLLAKMKEKGCEPNVWVYNSLIDMHGRAMNLRQVEKLWKEMSRKKVTPDKVSYTSIISAYSKAKEFKECVRLYQEFRMNGGKIDRAVAGIMVCVFSKSSRIDELVKLLQDAKMEGVRLDERLYMSALNALRDAGLQGQVRWFEESFRFRKADA